MSEPASPTTSPPRGTLRLAPVTDRGTSWRRPSRREPHQQAEAFSPDLAASRWELSRIVAQIRAIVEGHAAQPEVVDQFEAVASRLEAIVEGLLHPAASSRVVSRRSGGAGSPTTALPNLPNAEEAFLEWLSGPAYPDSLDLDDDDRAAVPISGILGSLSTSARQLGPEAAASVGLSATATIGDAATHLLLAVTDPAGPRCRSYRAAVYYLSEVAYPRALPWDEEQGQREQ